MSEIEFQKQLQEKETQLAQDANVVLNGILEANSTFTIDDLNAYAAQKIESFIRTHAAREDVSPKGQIALLMRGIDVSRLSEKDRERLAGIGSKTPERAAKIVRAVYARGKAAEICAGIEKAIKANGIADEEFVFLGDGRYTTEHAIEQEKTILKVAREMKERKGDPKAAAAAYEAGKAKGYGAFLEWPASNESFEEAGENTRAILGFSDIGILNGPPGTGKSTICQAVAFSLIADESHALMPANAKIYATSSNPKAADAIAKDLRKTLTIQDAPKKPSALGENPTADEIAIFEKETKSYADSIVRRNEAIEHIAARMGGKYAAAASLNYTPAQIAKMSAEAGKKGAKIAEKYAEADASEKEALDRELFNAYVQNAYNNTIGADDAERIEQISFEDMIADMNEGKVPQGSYVIIDEAGLMGRENMCALMSAARASKTKLLLVGDNLQIPPQEAGHPFNMIVREVAVRKDADGNTLTDEDGVPLEDTGCSLTTKKIMRQKSPEEAKAGIDLRNGVAQDGSEPGSEPRGIYVYAHKTYNGGKDEAMQFVDTDKETTARLIEDYLAFSDEKDVDKCVVLATTQEKADKLNDAIRAEKKARGQINPPFISCGDKEMGDGDRVIFTAAMSFGKVGVNPGETAKCRTDPEHPDVLTLEIGKNTVQIDMKNAQESKKTDNMTSSFALPLALAQGMSKSRAFLSLTRGDKLDGPNGLVAFTRHQDQMSAYISREAYADADALAKDITRFPQDMNAHDFMKQKDRSAAPKTADVMKKVRIMNRKRQYRRHLSKPKKLAEKSVIQFVLKNRSNTK